MIQGENISDARMQRLLRATHGRVPRRDTTSRYLVSKMNITGFYIMVIFLLGFLSLLLFYAQFSGILRWIIILLAISCGAFGTAYISSRKTGNPERLSITSADRRRPWDELLRFKRTLERAERNYSYSQLAAIERIRRMMIDRIQTQFDINEEEIDMIVHDRDTLMRMTGDRELTDFIMESERDLSNWMTIIREKLPVMPSLGGFGSFNRSVLHVLERMEDLQ